MNWSLFLVVLIAIESGGDPSEVGDTHLRNKAYGVCQIRQPYLDDVNRIMGTDVTMDEVRRSESVSRWCVVSYLRHYGNRYTSITSRSLDMEVAARMHNGGPDGWKKSSTDRYWMKFQAERLRCSR